MASRAKSICRHPGCSKLLDAPGYCAAHEQLHQVRKDDRRQSAAARGYDHRWRKAREQFLREHPLCVECRKVHRVVPATVVDHIVPHKNDQELFWDRANWQPLCKTHHDAKTAREDGGFGHAAVAARR